MTDLTIDELARRSGFTVRNIRSHHSRGLLPAPEVRGRTGYYGAEHLARLQLIKELQDEGLPLRIVERLLTEQPDAVSRMVALRRSVVPLPTEPLILSIDDLRDRFGAFDEADITLALALGGLEAQPDGRYLVPLPGLLDILDRATALGLSLRVALGMGMAVRGLSADAARIFVDTVRGEVWDPFVADGRPDDRWPQIASVIEQLRPLASEVFAQFLEPAITVEIERVFGEELRETAEPAERRDQRPT